MAPPDRAPGIRPRPSVGRRLDAAARAGFPTVCTLLLMVLATAPLGLPRQAALLPALTLGSVWFWAQHRPASLPPPIVFVLGLLLDLLGYQPLGVDVLVMLTAYAVALRARRLLDRQGLVVAWLAFALVAAGATLLDWGLTALLRFRLLPGSAAVFQFGITAALYPALSVLLLRADQSVADPGRA